MAGVVASRVRRKKEKETGREEEIRKNQLKVKVVEMWTYELNHWCKFPLTLGVLAPMSGGPGRGQFTARPTTRWEGPISRVCIPFPSTGFPGLGGPRECTPPRVWSRF